MRHFIALIVLTLLPFCAMAEEAKTLDQNQLELGMMEPSRLLAESTTFNWFYVEYVPKADAVESLHSVERPVEIQVIFGDWCSDSQTHVPALIKTLEFADNPNLQVSYINVDKEKQEPAELIEGMAIESVPTIIVKVKGREIGRIVESPKSTIEEDLESIIKKGLS